MAAEPNSVTFATTVAVSGNNTGIVVPEEVIEQLAAGKRPARAGEPQRVRIPQHRRVMSGKHMISISAAVPKATSLQGGDPHPGHPDRREHAAGDNRRTTFAAALAADEQSSAFFGELSSSMQRYYIDYITAAKSADTRQRRMGKAIALFRWQATVTTPAYR